MTKIFKNISLSVILIILITSCAIYVPSEEMIDNTRYSVEETFSYQITPGNQALINLSGINGSVTITGTSNDEVSIWGKRIVESESYDDADEHLDFLRVEVIERSDEIRVKTSQPTSSGGRNYKVNYHINIPFDWDVVVELVNGPVSVESIWGDVWVDLVNGNIDLNKNSGNVSVESTNGNIWGDLNIPVDGYCDMKLVNGNIDLMIPKSTDADISATVVNGLVTVDDLTFHYISHSRKSVIGSIGDGGANIEMSAVNGNITLRGK